MAEEDVTVDEDDVASRSELLPEEQAAGSDDPGAQAEAILAESEERTADRDAAPGSVVERRTSEDVAIDPG